jgi:DNA repair and recombination protein RAD54B
MARVHRDGQKRPCYIYRLLTQGALDEKIFQRQASKTELADSIIDGKASVSGFTREELRDLFTLDEGQDCQTHRLLGCGCGGNGMPLNAEDEEAESPRNDLPALSRAGKGGEGADFDENGVEILDLQHDGLPSYEHGLWRNSKDYDWKAEGAASRQKTSERNKMLSLMRYTHLDTSSVDRNHVDTHVISHGEENGEADVTRLDLLEGAVEDAILRSVLREQVQRISFVFTKLSS